MTTDELFTKVTPVEAERIKLKVKVEGKWDPVVAALGDGDVLRVRITMNEATGIGQRLHAQYPDKRLATQRTDDPAFRFLWLVPR